MAEIRDDSFAQIDFIICPAEWRNQICDARTFRDIPIGSHHFLLLCSFGQPIQLEKQNAWVISNENSQKFKCEMNLKGTSPGEKVLKLLNELYKCKTLLNEIQYDDMIEGEKIIQLIKKVKTNNN